MNNYVNKDAIMSDEVAIKEFDKLYQEIYSIPCEPEKTFYADMVEKIIDGIKHGFVVIREADNNEYTVIVKLSKKYKVGANEVEEIEFFEPNVEDANALKVDPKNASISDFTNMAVSITSRSNKDLIEKKLKMKELLMYIIPVVMCLYGAFIPENQKKRI